MGSKQFNDTQTHAPIHTARNLLFPRRGRCRRRPAAGCLALGALCVARHRSHALPRKTKSFALPRWMGQGGRRTRRGRACARGPRRMWGGSASPTRRSSPPSSAASSAPPSSSSPRCACAPRALADVLWAKARGCVGARRPVHARARARRRRALGWPLPIICCMAQHASCAPCCARSSSHIMLGAVHGVPAHAHARARFPL
jgi:hypothetical protein